MSMSKTIPAILALAFQKALAAHCDNERSAAALDRLMRVRGLQMRAAKHYRVPLMRGAR